MHYYFKLYHLTHVSAHIKPSAGRSFTRYVPMYQCRIALQSAAHNLYVVDAAYLMPLCLICYK